MSRFHLNKIEGGKIPAWLLWKIFFEKEARPIVCYSFISRRREIVFLENSSRKKIQI